MHEAVRLSLNIKFLLIQFIPIMPLRSKIEGHIVFILSFCPPLWNCNLANNFWTVSARAFVFHMNIPCDKTIIFDHVTLTLEFEQFL